MKTIIFIFTLIAATPSFCQFYIDVHGHLNGFPGYNAIFYLSPNSYSSSNPHPTPSFIPTDLIDTIDFVTYNSINGVTAITSPVVSSRSTKVIGGGIVISSNDAVASVGICWSNNPNPTMNDNISPTTFYQNYYFSYEICCLVPGRTYYARVFYADQSDTIYGNEISFTSANCFDGICTNPGSGVYDLNNNFYPSIVLGNGQEWMAKNLNIDKFSNGDPIVGLASNDWYTTTQPAFSSLTNFAFQEKYGKLYNWYTVNDSRNVCPTGWHVPTLGEFSTLITYLGGSNIAGGRMKLFGTYNSDCSAWANGESEWFAPNTKASNLSGFSAGPAGWVTEYGDVLTSYGSKSIFWTNSIDQSNSNLAVSFILVNINGILTQYSYPKKSGLSIRCIKD